VTFQLRAVPDGFSLGIDGVTVTMPIEHQFAEKPQRENIIRQLSKLGGTPYECLAVDMPDDFNYFIPSSQLAELRRLAIAAYSNASVEVSSGGNPTPSVGSVPPAYAQPYFYNASNQLSKEFYLNKGVKVSPAFEQAIPKEAVIMQCRHCLRFALGYCVKNGGRKPQWREPLSLRLGDGRRFRLEFDCRQCQMNILAETSLRDH
jgi:putative protease